MENFTPVPALIGGLLIGLSAVVMLGAMGRIAGISGILGGLLNNGSSDRKWRNYFLAGLVAGVALFIALGGEVSAINLNPFDFSGELQTGVLVAGGLLVGFGTQMGSGCTSGHGVCGLGRLSPRSLAATMIFMGIAGLVVLIIGLAVGG
jgi:hypothetical protein